MNLRNNENTIAFIIVLSVLVLVGFLWFAFENPALNPRLQKENYTILRKWKMPDQLHEISGITWIGEDRFVCVQDEEGILFIYNIAKEEIEETINFSMAGDYEGIAVVDSAAYVVRSDGELFEIQNYLSADFNVNSYKTPFSKKNDVESLTYDKDNNRLLLMPKKTDLTTKADKGIYAFELDKKEINPEPITRVLNNDPIFKNTNNDNKHSIYPSGIAIHPQTGEIYIVDGRTPQLLILGKTTSPVKLHPLRRKTFPQPEGISFAPDGRLFIASEGGNGPGMIMEVELGKLE